MMNNSVQYHGLYKEKERKATEIISYHCIRYHRRPIQQSFRRIRLGRTYTSRTERQLYRHDIMNTDAFVRSKE